MTKSNLANQEKRFKNLLKELEKLKKGTHESSQNYYIT
tara:strand:+ start:37 stop:150 length:114 start_codon:yes stop_codon:yes gene_type:complete